MSTNGHWTNTNNSLYRIFADRTEERCTYAGISHLTSSNGGDTTIPCAYCEQTIPGTAANCPGCGGPRLALVTKCTVQIEAMLPSGGRLMDLDAQSVLEIRRENWVLHDVGSPYFRDGGLSVRMVATRYQSWYPQKPVLPYSSEKWDDKEVKRDDKSGDKEQTIMRLSEFNMSTMFIDSPVPLDSRSTSALVLTMMLECKTEFFFGEKR